MKKVLSLVLALALVLGSFAPVFAAENEYAAEGAKLEELGVLAGDGNGLNLDGELTRAELYTLASRLMGQETTAKNYFFKGSSIFNDVNEGDWYDSIVGWAAGKGLTKGMGNDKFAPSDVVTVQQLQALMLRVLGYTDVEWDNVPAMATAKGIMGDIEALGNASRGLMAALAVNTLKSETATGTILAADLGYDELVVEEETVVEGLEVVSVTATNLKKVVVVFNEDVDEDVAGDKANYSIDNHTIESASVDGNVVTLTLQGKFAQQEEFTLVISEDFVDAEVTATAFDVTPPVAQKIELTGPSTFKITFSEPIETAGTILIDNGIYGTEAPVINGNTVSVDLAADLEDGEYEVEVSGFKDYAEFRALTKHMTLVYEEDTTAPVASIKEATQTKVVVEFNKPVQLEDLSTLTIDYFYHTFKAWYPVAVVPNADNTEFTLVFHDEDVNTTGHNYPIAEGTAKVIVNYDANSMEIVDLWGNSMGSDAELTATVSADKTAPKVTSIEAGNAQDKANIYFSEEVSMTNATITVKQDGEEINNTFNVSAPAQNEDDVWFVELDFSDNLAGTYAITIEGVEDTALERNEMTKDTVTVKIEDITAITTAKVKAAGVDGEEVDYIYITYPEKMAVSGAYSVLDKDNYLIDADLDVDGIFETKLGSNDKVEVFGSSNRIRIVLADETKFNFAELDTLNLQIGRVADAAGNTITDLAFGIFGVAQEVAPTIEAIDVLDYNKVQITVDKILTSVSAKGFHTGYTVNGQVYSQPLASVSYKVEDGQTIITGILRATSQLPQDDTSDISVQLLVVEKMIKADYGMYVQIPNQLIQVDTNNDGILDAWAGDLVDELGVVVAPADARAPELADVYAAIATDTLGNLAPYIGVEFTEDIDATYAVHYASDLVVKNAEGEVLTAGIDYDTIIVTVTYTDGSIVDVVGIIVNGVIADTELDGYTVQTKDTVTYIRDAAGNLAEAFGAQTVEIGVALQSVK